MNSLCRPSTTRLPFTAVISGINVCLLSPELLIFFPFGVEPQTSKAAKSFDSVRCFRLRDELPTFILDREATRNSRMSTSLLSLDVNGLGESLSKQNFFRAPVCGLGGGAQGQRFGSSIQSCFITTAIVFR